MVKFQNLIDDGYNFFTGVPDSGLKMFINDIIKSDYKHIVYSLSNSMLSH